MKEYTNFSNIIDDPRSDGRQPMRTAIRNLAREVCRQNSQQKNLASLFSQPFSELKNSKSRYLLPNAMKEGFRNVFLFDRRIKFYDEVDIIIPVADDKEDVFPLKRIDYLVTNTESKKCIVIELKTSMGFDGYAASLIEFMLLHSNKNITMNKKRNAFNDALNNMPLHGMDILHILCSVNFPDHIEQWTPLLTRGTPLENKIETLLIFAPFRYPGHGQMPSPQDTSNYINDFMTKVMTWLQAGLPNEDYQLDTSAFKSGGLTQ
ncbi:hypothetical protein [Gluconobacter albidus]|uniref:Uncharacterized protein n=1 Tax=Gluconobacter albidus TaxID=318683 RepID=A0ABQ5X116_9PROT|nr:hypothetical protein [Gluconobacter albidus]GBQ90259.1 hypothetical protein AA3250_2012 [Gluconobacter albidus NBRC 3250]GLQ69521.1 hypothetical protein GCM10007866_19740 [Gluconobacter albidus]